MRIAGAALLAFAMPLGAHDFNGDGKADVVWQNKSTGENLLWLRGPIDGVVTWTERALPTNQDPNWKLVAVGYFDLDTEPDLLFQHLGRGTKAVWFTQAGKIKSTALMTQPVEAGFEIVGAARIDPDSYSDLLLQHRVTGEKVIWLMNGLNQKWKYTLDRTSGPDWRMTATGDFNGDGRDDIILCNRSTGEIAAWLIKNVGSIAGVFVTNPSGGRAVMLDHDYQLAAAGDFNGDRKTDLIWRHATLGINQLWFMNGTANTRSVFLSPLFDTDWRLGAQSFEESRWRLEPDYGITVRVAASAVPPQIALESSLKLPPGQTIQVSKTLHADMADKQTLVVAPSFEDRDVKVGLHYRYEIQPGGNDKAVALSASVEGEPFERRGGIVLFVDSALVDGYPELNDSLAELESDLIGDGWWVSRHDVPRHDDRTTELAYSINRKSLLGLKTIAAMEYEKGARGIYVIGHVTVPFSGKLASDGHVQHSGAWPADMFLGDLNSELWTDVETHPNNDRVSAISSNNPGDGKFDQDFAPSALELFVGRVDFARLVLFGTVNLPTKAEADLIRQYLAKAHRYKHAMHPFPLPETGIAYGNFGRGNRTQRLDAAIYENAKRNLSALYVNGLAKITVGDPFLQPSRRFTWALQAGLGRPDGINEAQQFVQHTSAELRAGLEPQVAFYILLGSYFGDWNLRDNFMKSLLTAPNYGLAAVWIDPLGTRWSFESMGVGEPLGQGLLDTVNRQSGQNAETSRVLAILGDPTLRAHTVPPPSTLTGSRIGRFAQLIWDPPFSGAGMHVYRASAREGPYERVTLTPVSEIFFLDRDPPIEEPYYMVRTAHMQQTGSGSYLNLSQALFVAIE